MNKVLLFLKSRTFLTILAMVAFNLLQSYRPLIAVQYQAIVDVLMTALAGYYKTNPSQDYVTPKSAVFPTVAPATPVIDTAPTM